MRMEIKKGECGINDWKDFPKSLSHPTRVKPKLKRMSSRYRRHISKIITQEAAKEARK